MPYCHSCGAKLSDDAAFCSKCGTKVVGGNIGATSSADELRDAFTRMSEEIERAFGIAAREAQEALKTARNNIQRTVYKEPIACPNCGEKNPASASYCYKCGNKLSEQTAEPKKDKQPM